MCDRKSIELGIRRALAGTIENLIYEIHIDSCARPASVRVHIDKCSNFTVTKTESGRGRRIQKVCVGGNLNEVGDGRESYASLRPNQTHVCHHGSSFSQREAGI